LGAHYTDREKIDLIIQPTLIRPLRREWDGAKTRIAAALAGAEAPAARAKALAEDRKAAEDAAASQDRAAEGGRPAGAAERASLQARLRKVKADALKAATTAQTARAKAQDAAAAIYHGFVDRLREFRVLDPACGSGNFLYLALMALKDIEHQAALEAETFGLRRRLPEVGPENLLGIEINPYAAELARVVVWIGNIQWSRRNGMGLAGRPILKPLNTIECRDAVLDGDRVAHWPKADAILGNPPFIGPSDMRRALGDSYTEKLRDAYAGRVPGGADFVCFWFDKAREQVLDGRAMRVGLVATQSIRKGASRKVLDSIRQASTIYDAWDDEPWILDGAAVRVSLICFTATTNAEPAHLDGNPVASINSDLTTGLLDLTVAAGLSANRRVAFMGVKKDGPFDISRETAADWLAAPANPNGRTNADVLRPWLNGQDITQRPSDRWIIDFSVRSETDGAFYVKPFAHAVLHVKPLRDKNRRERRKRYWWQHGETVPGLRAAMMPITRFIATPRVAKHRVFVWCSSAILPDSRVYAFARDDETTFGILHSRFHEAWSLAIGSRHGAGNDPTYNSLTCFETFPFPEGLTPNLPAASYAADPRAIRIGNAARALTTARDRWLNPPEWVEEVPDLLPHLPPRRIPRNADAARQVKARTLTNLYNTRGTPEGAWIDALHADLDRAVAAAYGWPEDIAVDDALARLLALNQTRAGR
jgi:type II restriction/modification system DNA methylase subunit YeeA